MKYKILVTSLLAGMGHIMAKDSIVNSLKGKSDKYEIYEYNSDINLYDKGLKLGVKFPKIYKKLYPDQKPLPKIIQNFIYNIERKKVKEIIEKTNPDLIITTHPFHSMVFDKIRSKEQYNYKIANLVCDYGDQPGYIFPSGNFDYLLFRDKNTQEINKNYHDKPSFVFGKEIKKDFFEIGKKEQNKKQKTFSENTKNLFGKNIDLNKQSILFIGGSGWAKAAKDMILNLANKLEYNILVSCGRDKKFFEYLKNKENIFPFLYVDQKTLASIEGFVDISVLTAFGPNVMLELLNIGKYPIFVHKTTQPQEKTNLQFLDIYNIGIYEDDEQKMIELINDYLDNKDKYQKYIDNQKKFVEENQKIAENNYKTILEILKE